MQTQPNKIKNFLLASIWLALSLYLVVNHSDAAEQPVVKQKVSLDFQDIKVRDVFKILAEFTNENMVISDTVQGSITLHLHDVLWDQALAFILTTQGLAKRQIDNIIFIAPAAEIAKQEQANLQAQQAMSALEPLSTRSFQLNYSNVDTYYDLLKDPSQTLLSPRGKVVKLATANSLIVEDTPDKLQLIAKLFKNLDQPAKQVLIEARILYVDTDYEQRLGVVWGKYSNKGKFLDSYKGLNMDLSPGSVVSGSNTAIGTLSLGSFLAGSNLDLQLQAIEAEGKGELISSPRILTSNNVTSSIEQGQQIPYTAQSASGGTTTLFVKALLHLEVTPQITPNNKLLLSLTINQDQQDDRKVPKGQQPAINTRQLKTTLLVNNNQTVVLGGIYQHNNTVQNVGIPWLSQIPLIGTLFKSKTNSSSKSELLIFLTPKIVMTTKDAPK